MEFSSTYPKIKQKIIKYKRLSIGSWGINNIWSMDNADMDKIANQISVTKNRSVEVDVLSRYLRVQPKKNRFATTVENGFLKKLNIDDPLFRFKYG